MNALEAKQWLKRIIKQREYTLNHNCCHRNKLLMANTCQRMSTLLSANPYHGDTIFGFIRRHYTDILILIPANQAEKQNLKTLNELLAKWQQSTINSSPKKSRTLSCMQLSLFF
jgi:hypothetical protein